MLESLTGPGETWGTVAVQAKYRDIEKYRLAWDLRSPQLNKLPDVIDIELTRTGLSLFQLWTPS